MKHLCSGADYRCDKPIRLTKTLRDGMGRRVRVCGSNRPARVLARLTRVPTVGTLSVAKKRLDKPVQGMII